MLAASYDGSGYVRDIKMSDVSNRTRFAEAVRALQESGWVDRQTRGIFVSLNLYNANLNYYCLSTFMLEFSEVRGRSQEISREIARSW